MSNIEKQYLSDEGYALMGAVFEVHREMGSGLYEDEVRKHVDGAPQACPQQSGG